jgi:Tol biopolymer transport system component
MWKLRRLGVAAFVLGLGISVGLVNAASEGWLLFTSDRDGNRDIYAMSSDGGNVTRLTSNVFEDRDPAWSPDYQQIAYVSYMENGDSAIFIMNADGSSPRRLTEAFMGIAPESPTWSPDGRQIAFVTAGSSGLQIQVVNVDGSGFRRLIESTQESVDPAWSPDGRKIAYAVPQNAEYSAIFVADVSGGSVPSQLSREDGGESRSPAWSPDGTQIIYAVTGGIHGDAVMLRDADGVLTSLYSSSSFVDSPVWSPDGTMIAFNEGTGRAKVIQVMNADGSNVRPLSDGEYLAWAAPDLIEPAVASVPTSGVMARPVTSGVITTARLNMRSQPDPEAYIVARISLNDTVGIVGRNPEGSWVLVDIFGRAGWVNADYVTIDGGVGALPVLNGSDPLPTASSLFTFSCTGALGPSMTLNSRFFVPAGDGPTAVRLQPSSREVLERAPEGSGGTVIAGPVCAAAGEDRLLIYWYVQTDAGTRGYISEGFVESPVPWSAPS